MFELWKALKNKYANGIYNARVDMFYEAPNVSRDDNHYLNALHLKQAGNIQLGNGMAPYINKYLKERTPINLTLTSIGDGSGVATLTMQSYVSTTITLGTNAKFYTNSAGTENESSTWTITPGADRTIYIKCTTGTATFVIGSNTIIKWGAWTSGTNAPSIGGSITSMDELTYLWVQGNNTLSGNINNFKLTSIDLRGSGSVEVDLRTISTKLVYCNITKGTVTYTQGGNWGSLLHYLYVDTNATGLTDAMIDLLIIEIESTRVPDRHLNIGITGAGLGKRTSASDAAVAAIVADTGSVTTNP